MTDVLKHLWTVLDVVGLISLCLYGLHMLLAALFPARRPMYEADETLRFTFLIPALNEAQVIAATVLNLRERAPDARVVVIDDASEDGTGAVLRGLAEQDGAVRVLCRTAPQARQGKGAALNWATERLLAELRADGADLARQVFVVVDADGRITPALLQEARVAMADEQVMGAQARVRIRASGTRLSLTGLVGRLLEQQQDLEFFIIGHVQRLRTRWHSVALCGNGQFMRASYLEAQGARGQRVWPDCLSEDVASGLELRLAAQGHRMVFLDAAVTQQGMPSLWRFVRQRARWSQGTLQCAPYLPRLWSAPLGWEARLDLSYFLLNPWISAVLLMSLFTQPLRHFSGTPEPTINPLVSALITLLNVGLQLHWVLRYAREQRLALGGLTWTLVGLPLYALALGLSLPLALWHHGSGRRTWDKSSRHAEAGDLSAASEGLS